METYTIIIASASLISACTVIITAINKIFNKKLNPLEKKIEDLDINQCKSFLVDAFSDIKSGIEKNPVQIARIYEVYDHYTKKGGNSYIHEEFEKLQKENKL